MAEHQWKELSKYFLDNGNRKLFKEEKETIKLVIDHHSFYSRENMTRLKESVAQMEATGGTVYEEEFDD